MIFCLLRYSYAALSFTSCSIRLTNASCDAVVVNKGFFPIRIAVVPKMTVSAAKIPLTLNFIRAAFFLFCYGLKNKFMATIYKLTKPSLVDLLRMCDRNRWCNPRIRYASIRSKPELCRDLLVHFSFAENGDFISISPLRKIHNFPRLQYHSKERRFWKNGRPFDAARVSRQKPVFHLERKKTTLHFGPLHGGRGSDIGVAVSAMFP